MSAHRPVTSVKLPAPRGPYSPGVRWERLVFVSGQGAADPSTGQMVGDDVESHTEQCLKNIAAILQAAGSGLPYVLRCGVFLADISEFSRMNGVYQRMFGDNRPARTTIQAAALPAPGLRVEIDAIAYIPVPRHARGTARRSAAKVTKAAKTTKTATATKTAGRRKAK